MPPRTFIVVAAAALLGLAAPRAEADTLTIRADEWFPINAEPGSEYPGFMIELADAILTPHGDVVDYRLMPWDDALASARSGTTDCVVGALASETKGLTHPRRAWLQSKQSLYAAVGRTITYRGMENLTDLRIAVVDGYSYGDALDAYLETNKRRQGRVLVVDDSARAQRELMMRLLVGHADVVLETSVVMDAAIRRSGMSERIRLVGPADPAAPPEDLYIACTGNNARTAEYIRKFDEGLLKAETDGTLARLRERYGLGSNSQ